jgi:hypothetical protein
MLSFTFEKEPILARMMLPEGRAVERPIGVRRNPIIGHTCLFILIVGFPNFLLRQVDLVSCVESSLIQMNYCTFRSCNES